MKVLFISHSNVIENYRDKLEYIGQNKDIDLSVIIPKKYKEGGSLVSSNYNAGTYTLYRLNCFFSKNARQHLHFYPNLFYYLLKINPDIIHLEEEPRSFISVLTIFLNNFLRLNSKIVFYTALVQKSNWQLKFKHNIRGYIYPLFENYSFKHSVSAISINKEAKKILKEKGFNKPISVIPENGGVNTSVFIEKKCEKNDFKNTFIIGFIGRIAFAKGVHILFKAANIIKKCNFKLLIIGKGDNIKHYKNLADKLDILDRIIWVNHVEHSKIVDYINCMNVLVLPSIETKYSKEQFGRVLVEAMACKTPVVGSDCGGIPEVINDPKMIFEQEDYYELADILEKLINNKEFRNQKKESLYNQTVNKYSNEVIAKQIVDHYKSIYNN